MKRNPQEEITARILEAMNSGALPWRRPWREIASEGFPCNAITNRPYSGGNVVLLHLRQMSAGWPTMRFLTFKQAKEAGGTIRKGEHGTQVVFLSRHTKRDSSGEESSYAFLKVYTVFNISQCESLPERLTAHTPIAIKDPISRNDDCDAFIHATGAEIHHGGSRAFYRPATDSITLPEFDTFHNADGYYGTAFHELAHWTGHDKRLARGKGNSFGSKEYAFEELVAEISAAYVCAEFQVENIDQTAAYLQSWISLLKDDARAFFRAASAASKATDYLRGLAAEDDDNGNIEEAA